MSFLMHSRVSKMCVLVNWVTVSAIISVSHPQIIQGSVLGSDAVLLWSIGLKPSCTVCQVSKVSYMSKLGRLA